MPELLPNPWPNLQRVAVLGLGRSGLAVARLLSRFPLQLILSDASRSTPPDFMLPGTTLTLGQNTLGDAQLAVISLASPIDHPCVKEAYLRGIELVSELDLGAQLLTPMLAITGTDGKTTTTSLCAHILQHAGFKTEAVGNIGTPLCEVLDEANTWDIAVVETSAFQLWNAPNFSPKYLIATNVAPDHLDYFLGDYAYYARTKRRPLDVMTPDAWAILNAHDAEIRTWPRFTEAQIAWFARDPALIPSSAVAWATIMDGQLTVYHQNRTHPLMPLENLPIHGDHNILNALAGALATMLAGASAAKVAKALATFTAPPHRIQTVAVQDGIQFIDDSKATNPHAASAALKAVPGLSVLIAGGVDKQLSLDDWILLMPSRVVAVVLIGQLAPRLKSRLAELAPTIQVHDADSMQTAVQTAYYLACGLKAKNVLLSPGCSSFDMFKSYSARGDAFKDAALKLKKR